MSAALSKVGATDAAAWRPLAGSRSALVAELADLGPQLCKELGIPPVVISVVDHVVTIAKALGEPNDSRHWAERLDDALGPIDQDVIDAWQASLDQLDEDWITREVGPVFTAAKLRFINRLVGQKHFDRLRSALASDAEATLNAIRRVLQQVRPLVVAACDAADLLEPGQLERTGLEALMHDSLFTAIVEIDHFLAGAANEVAAGRFDFSVILTQRNLETEIRAVRTSLRTLLSNDTDERLASANKALHRKMKGARDAIAFSADGPAQAASSLVELIEGLVRDYATEDQVLAWLETDYPGRKADLSHDDLHRGKRPTKRCRLLHYLYGGRHLEETEPLNESMAFAFTNARNALEGIKHGSHDHEYARQIVEETLRSLTGALSILLRIKASNPDDHAALGTATRAIERFDDA